MQKWMIASLLTLAPVMYSQQGRVAGPVAGYVFDGGARVLRPVLGVPGASVLGSSIELGMALSSAAISPRLDSVLATAADGSFHIFNLSSGAAAEIAVNGIAGAPERVAFSPAGSAAALYSGSRLQIVTGLPASPVAGSTFDLTPYLALPGGKGHRTFTDSFAVSDDGAYLLVAGAAGVQLFGSGGSRQLVSTRNTAVAFLPGSHDAAAAGTGLLLIKDVGGAATQQVLAQDDASQAAVGLAASADGGQLYLASQQGVAAFDLAAGSHNLVKCDCSPAGITGMGSLYRLNEVGTAPLWLFDTTATGPRIVFVPADSR
ncbi:MAG TPA: hypothetical protein VG456_00610 [Candidatus Sulfopaludibacter sp.]|jgi:hypothetical protein|nr:hypothetical protein [Candidatus Sulfopaludibacter sp.]